MLQFKEYVIKRDAVNEGFVNTAKYILMKGVSKVFQIGAPIAAAFGAVAGGVVGFSQWEWFMHPHDIVLTIVSVLAGLVMGGIFAHEGVVWLSDLAEEVAMKIKKRIEEKKITSKEGLKIETQQLAKEIIARHGH